MEVIRKDETLLIDCELRFENIETLLKNISQIHVPNIKDVSFSNTSPDVLYVLVGNEIFSLNVSTLTHTKMVMGGLHAQQSGPILSLLCQDEFIYITHGMQLNYILYKCIVKDDHILNPVGSYSEHNFHNLHACAWTRLACYIAAASPEH